MFVYFSKSTYFARQDEQDGNLKNKQMEHIVKFIYSEKATKVCEISNLLLTIDTVKSKVEISQNLWPSQNI